MTSACSCCKRHVRVRVGWDCVACGGTVAVGCMVLSLHNAHHTQCTFSTRNSNVEFPNIYTSKTCNKTSNGKILDITFTRLSRHEYHRTAEACGLTGMIRRLDAMTVPCAHTIQPIPCALCFVHVIALCYHVQLGISRCAVRVTSLLCNLLCNLLCLLLNHRARMHDTQGKHEYHHAGDALHGST